MGYDVTDECLFCYTGVGEMKDQEKEDIENFKRFLMHVRRLKVNMPKDIRKKLFEYVLRENNCNHKYSDNCHCDDLIPSCICLECFGKFYKKGELPPRVPNQLFNYGYDGGEGIQTCGGSTCVQCGEETKLYIDVPICKEHIFYDNDF